MFTAPVTILLLAVGSFASVLAHSRRRRGRNSLAFQAAESLSSFKAVWDFVAIVSMLLGFSIVVWALLVGVWWQALIVWVLAGLVGGVVGGMVWPGLQEGALNVERFAHLTTILTSSTLWLWTIFG